MRENGLGVRLGWFSRPERAAVVRQKRRRVPTKENILKRIGENVCIFRAVVAAVSQEKYSTTPGVRNLNRILWPYHGTTIVYNDGREKLVVGPGATTTTIITIIVNSTAVIPLRKSNKLRYPPSKGH